MSLLTNCRAFLPACLSLGALLCVLPVLADAPVLPAPLVPAAGPIQAQSIPLQHAVPGDILKTMHWDQRAALPVGVTSIVGVPVSNSLLVQATPAGLAEVRELVKLLDIAPRLVEIRFALAKTTPAALDALGIDFDLVPQPGLGGMPPTFMRYATGSRVSQLLQTLTKQKAILSSSVVVTANNRDAALSLSGGQAISGLPDVTSFTYSVIPRVNSDDSVTMALHPQAAWRVAGKTNPDGSPAAPMQDLRTLRTVRSGATLVIANLFAGAAGAKGDQLLLFVTPTIVSTGKGPAAITVK